MKRPALMGVVNVTPDSFSGDGKLAEHAFAHAHDLMKAGADILDIGAESTRPHATPLTAEAEWQRLQPVLTALHHCDWRESIRLSVDTRHAQTAGRALALGVDIINDVGGLRDHAMAEILAEHDCDVVVMHALSLPADPNTTLPHDCDVVRAILDWKRNITKQAAARGIAAERLIYDAGIGFGKTAVQSLKLMTEAAILKQSGGRWLFGHSRKSFLTLFTDAASAQRDDLTLAWSAQLAASGIDYVRVHEVARHTALFEKICT
jgi:dihydropteroate synthase